jgi:hypothetical protein
VFEQHAFRLRGGAATIVWGYHTAAAVASWQIRKTAGGWTLSAICREVNPFHLRQPSLIFAVPRRGGHWAWPIVKLECTDRRVMARLGPPEQ